MQDGYTLNPQPTQDSIIAGLKAAFPGVTVIEEGLLDDDNSAIQYYDGGIKGFLVTHFSNPKPVGENRGKSFAGHRLDQRKGSVDIVAVARSGPAVLKFSNKVYDAMIGFQTDRGGKLTDGVALWADARQIAMPEGKPTRWGRTLRFEFGLNATKVP